MVDGLLDTAIVVDLLRGYRPAEAWFAGLNLAAITPMVWLEVIQGVENKREQESAVKLLSAMDRVDLTTIDFDWAIEQALRFRLSHNIDMMDCLIAAPSHRLGVKVYTMNLRHFEPMLRSLCERPYEYQHP